jgi:hypothetical protein
VDDRQAGDEKRDHHDNLNDVVRGNAKSAAVIGLARSVGVPDLNNSAYQDKQNAKESQES